MVPFVFVCEGKSCVSSVVSAFSDCWTKNWKNRNLSSERNFRLPIGTPRQPYFPVTSGFLKLSACLLHIQLMSLNIDDVFEHFAERYY